MVFIYNLFIRLYFCAIRLLSFVNPKAKAFIEGREHWRLALAKSFPLEEPDAFVIWIHCASLGEFEQAKPLIEALRLKYAQAKLVLTFFSPSGYEAKRNYDGVNHVYYLPMDTHKNARDFITLLRPDLTFFVKYDLWYHFLTQLRKTTSKMYLIDALFTSNQIFFKPFGILHRKMLKCFDHIFVQNESSLEALKTINIENVSVAGDTRFDSVIKVKNIDTNIPYISELQQQYRLLIAGSTWSDDEELLKKLHTQLPEHWKLIIVPHDINSSRIQHVQSLFPNCTLWSDVQQRKQVPANLDVLVIDTIGLLSKVYRYAHLAWIGGGFTKSGIHNCLEAAVYGVPISFGPNFSKYNEANQLVALGGALVCSNNDALYSVVMMLNEDATHKAIGSIAQKYVYEHIGATDLIINKLRDDV